jgi:mRNA interferase MazF
VALCYQAVVLDKERFIRKIGTLTGPFLERLRQALIYTLSLDEGE